MSVKIMYEDCEDPDMAIVIAEEAEESDWWSARNALDEIIYVGGRRMRLCCEVNEETDDE